MRGCSSTCFDYLKQVMDWTTLVGGLGKPLKMASGFRKSGLYLNCQVSNIDWSGKQVSVTTEAGSEQKVS